MPTLPSLYISHGSPMTALQPGATGARLAELAQTLPRPTAIVIASAHWLAHMPLVGGAAQPEIIHDFGGFPPALYQLHYPAPGAPALAAQVTELLDRAGLAPQLDPQRGLDHGVWVPLRLLYPAADIPVVPLSIQPDADATAHYRLGRALAGLADEGVLVIGSGGFVHNLGELDWSRTDAPMPAWAREFHDWMRGRVLAGDTDALLEWERKAPHARRAHPTTEHLLPLFVALGAAAGRDRIRHLHDSHEYGTLALDAFACH